MMVANKTPAFLLQEILDPNRNVDSRYTTFSAVLKSGSAQEKKDAAFASELILRSRDTSGIEPGTKVLYPSEYEVRADALILARQLVGGVVVAGDK